MKHLIGFALGSLGAFLLAAKIGLYYHNEDEHAARCFVTGFITVALWFIGLYLLTK